MIWWKLALAAFLSVWICTIGGLTAAAAWEWLEDLRYERRRRQTELAREIARAEQDATGRRRLELVRDEPA